MRKKKKKRTRIASNDDKAVVGVIVAADRLVIAMHVGNFKEPLNLLLFKWAVKTYQLSMPREQLRPTKTSLAMFNPRSPVISLDAGELLAYSVDSQQCCELTEHWLPEGLPEGFARLAPLPPQSKNKRDGY